ncbi:glycine--tRNA ligase subunit beta, partial [Sphingorhabdus sp.]|uniref:glycine--tRNA ligase subunit beta n=1 Tax=Sphingorhabdus sp. TaxID=1902408 RepID=UPI0025FDB39A
ELQGIMGGYYARAQGESDAVADAIRDHYKPVGQGDDVPNAPVTVAVSLADKLDTVTGFFGINQRPTGSKDPFALRRAALGVISLITANDLRLGFRRTLIESLTTHGVFWWNRLVDAAERIDTVSSHRMSGFLKLAGEHQIKLSGETGLGLADAFRSRLASEEVPAAAFDFADIKQQEIVPFFGERLAVQQREAGVRHDLIDAVFSLGGEDDLVRLLARVKALQAYITTAEGANLLAAYKRAANILKQADGAEKTSVAPAQAGAHHVSQSGTTDETGSSLRWSDADLGIEESALRTALDAAEPKAAAALSVEDFEGAMAALATLRAPIDAFFEAVMVNDPDPAKRKFRLGLLARFRDAVTQVADFSKIEG